MKRDEEIIMGCLVYILILIILFCVNLLVFGYGGIFIFAGLLVLAYMVARKIPDQQKYHKTSNEYFTNEDFMHCKIGEWVSKK